MKIEFPTLQQNNSQLVSGDYFSDWSPNLKRRVATTSSPAEGCRYSFIRLKAELVMHTRQRLWGDVGLHVEGLGLTLYFGNLFK
jgi:hypothetical protein